MPSGGCCQTACGSSSPGWNTWPQTMAASQNSWPPSCELSLRSRNRASRRLGGAHLLLANSPLAPRPQREVEDALPVELDDRFQRLVPVPRQEHDVLARDAIEFRGGLREV